MRSILEKALIAALNKDEAQATALFHDFILERSRQIHESLRQGEDFVLDESWEQDLAVDEMFSEADLEDDPIPSDEELGFDQPASDVDAPVADEPVDAPVGDDAGVEPAQDGEEAIEDRVEDVEAQLSALSAEFDALRDELGLTDEEVVQEATIEVTDGETTVVVDTADVEAAVAAPVDTPVGDFDDMGGEFDRLSESLLDELTSITVDTADGELLGGDKVELNVDSPIPSNDVDSRQGGEPIEVNAEEHKGFDLESAPKVEKL